MSFIYGEKLQNLLELAKQNGFAIPAVNVTNSHTIVACLEAAKLENKPIIIQFSYGGSQFIAGKGVDNSKHQASILGAEAGARLVHQLAPLYGVDYILHTDHCHEENLPWIDGLLESGEKFFLEHGYPLFSSHMLDLSLLPVAENINISSQYFTRMKKLDMWLEVEIGVTGGEEDGVNHEDIENSRLYTQPTDVDEVYIRLMAISPHFSIAASFGNVHGVYAPGNVKLHPEILKNSQEYIQQKYGLDSSTPVNFVFHGGSGSTESEIRQAIEYGVVKLNLDTDLQWAFFEGVKNYYQKNEPYLQSKLGNPEGAEQPNKKYYDPRKWLREGELNFIAYLKHIYTWIS